MHTDICGQKQFYETRHAWFKKSLRKKNHLWKTYLSTHSFLHIFNFKLVNNQLKSLTCNLGKDYEKKLFQDAKTRRKAFWQYVTSRTKIYPSVTELVFYDDSVIHSNIEIVTLLINISLVCLCTCEDIINDATVDSTGSSLSSDSIEITPTVVLNKLSFGSAK